MFGFKTKREVELEKLLEDMTETNRRLFNINKSVLKMNDELVEREMKQVEMLTITKSNIDTMAKNVKTVLAVCDKYDEYLQKLMINVCTTERHMELDPIRVANLGEVAQQLHTTIVTLHMEDYRFMYRDSITELKEELMEFLRYTDELKNEVREYELFKPEDCKYPRT